MQVLKCHQLVNNHLIITMTMESGIIPSLSDKKIKKYKIDNVIKQLKIVSSLMI